MITQGIDMGAEGVVQYMITKGLTLSAAESCTGGMLAQTVTSVAGASGMFPGGLVAYSEEVKAEVLGVRKETLEKFTVYSAETASDMSRGAMKLFGTDLAVGITGLAGPGGGTPEKPVGSVWVSVRWGGREICRDLALYKKYEALDRRMIRELATAGAMGMLREMLGLEKAEASYGDV